MNQKKEIGLYIIANYAYVGINAISNLFVSKLLGPVVLGVISYFNAIDSNLNSFVLGIIRSSIEREIPQIEEENQKREFGESAFTLNLICICLFSVLYLFIYILSEQSIMQHCALWLCVLSFVKGIYDCCRIWHKANFNITQVSYVMLISALAIPPVVLVLSYFFDYNGFWFGRIVIVLTSLFVILKWMPRIHLGKPSFKLVKYIFVSGGPIILFGLIQTIYQTLDKYILNYMLGFEELGYYSIGAMAFTMMLLLPQSFVGAIFPRFVARKNEDLRLMVSKYSYCIQIISVLFSIAGIIALPPLIKLFLPRYEASIPVLNTFFLGFVAYSSCQLKYVDLIRTNNIKDMLLFCAVPFVMSLFLFIVFVNSSYGICEMALLTSFNFLMLSTGVSLAWCKVNQLGLFRSTQVVGVHLFLCLITYMIINYDIFKLF